MSDYDDVLALVRQALAKSTPAQRVALLCEWFAGYCAKCGEPLHVVCRCQDEKAVQS